PARRDGPEPERNGRAAAGLRDRQGQGDGAAREVDGGVRQDREALAGGEGQSRGWCAPRLAEPLAAPASEQHGANRADHRGGAASRGGGANVSGSGDAAVTCRLRLSGTMAPSCVTMTPSSR